MDITPVYWDGERRRDLRVGAGLVEGNPAPWKTGLAGRSLPRRGAQDHELRRITVTHTGCIGDGLFHRTMVIMAPALRYVAT
jgi:hypothetical protein